MKSVLVLTALFLTGCIEPQNGSVAKPWGHDYKLQKEIFTECLKNTPIIPKTLTAVTTEGGDIISECQHVAREQSQCPQDSSPECVV